MLGETVTDEFFFRFVHQFAILLVNKYIFRIDDLRALFVQNYLVQRKGQGDIPVGVQLEIIIIHRLVKVERRFPGLGRFHALVFIFQWYSVYSNFGLRHERVRFVVIESLEFVAADLLQELDLFFCFHSFCQGINAKFIGHFHEFFNDYGVLPVEPETLDKLHVQFDQVKVKILQHIKGRETGAEVVHPDIEAGFVETPDLFFQVLLIDALYGFRNFNNEHFGRKLCVPDPFADFRYHVAAFKVVPGNVDGESDYRQMQFLASFYILQGQFRNAQIQLIQQFGFFQNGDEFPGGKHAQGGIVPAGQRFLGADGAGGAADDGLVIGLDIVIADGLIQVFDNIAFTFQLLLKVFRIEAVILNLAVFDYITGDLCQIANQCGRGFIVFYGVDTGFDIHFVFIPKIQHGFMEPVDLIHQVFRFREHHKVIVGQAEHKIIIVMFDQQGGNAFQDLIAGSHAVFNIKIFKVGDIIKDQRLPDGRSFVVCGMQHHLAAFHETAHARQAGQFVDVDGLLLGLDVYDKHIEHFALLRIPVHAAEFHNGFDLSGPGNDAVIQMIQMIDVGFQLLFDGRLRGTDIVRMHQSPESPACQIEKLFCSITFKNAQQFMIGIQQFFVAVGFVHEKSSGDVGQPVGDILLAEICV